MTAKELKLKPNEKGLTRQTIVVSEFDLSQALHEYLLQNGQIHSDAEIVEVHTNDVAYLTDPEKFPGLSITLTTPEKNDGTTE